MTAIETSKLMDDRKIAYDVRASSLMTTKSDETLVEEQQSEDPPPPYQSHIAPLDQPNVSTSLALHTRSLPQSHPLTDLPCVIPQTSKALRGAFYSPFIRAYPPSLAAHDISREDFLTFIDGLNEVFISHPLFQGVNLAGAIMGMCYGVSPVQYAGMGLQVASGIAGATTSYVRTRAYFKTCNEGLFHPKGLHATVVTTQKMMQMVGHPEPDSRLRLEPQATAVTGVRKDEIAEQESQNDITSQNDFRTRRMQALEGYVAPLHFDVPEPVAPSNVLNKMSAWQSRKMERKQQKKWAGREEKHSKKLAKAHGVDHKAERRNAKRDSKLDEKRANLDSELAEKMDEVARKQVKLEKELGKACENGDEKEIKRIDKDLLEASKGGAKEGEKLRRKYEEDMEKAERKYSKKMGKTGRHAAKHSRKAEKRLRKAEKSGEKLNTREEKHANKIRWVVIMPWNNQDDEQDESTEEEDEEDSGSSISDAFSNKK